MNYTGEKYIITFEANNVPLEYVIVDGVKYYPENRMPKKVGTKSKIKQTINDYIKSEEFLVKLKKELGIN